MMRFLSGEATSEIAEVELLRSVRKKSRTVREHRDARMFGAARAAEDHVVMLDAVTDHLAAAMRASRRERVDGTFERVEGVLAAFRRDSERLVVLITARITLRHGSSPEFGAFLLPGSMSPLSSVKLQHLYPC